MPSKPKPPSAFIQINAHTGKATHFSYNPSASEDLQRRALREAMSTVASLCRATGIDFPSLFKADERKWIGEYAPPPAPSFAPASPDPAPSAVPSPEMTGGGR